MRTTTFNPPADLPTGKGIYATLAIPFDEPVNDAHELAGTSYTWGDLRLPRKVINVLDGHDGEVVGTASHFILTRAGIWCAIKLGRRGEEILRRGTGVSAEILVDEITHIALTGYTTPGFASAGLYDGGDKVLVADEPLRLSMDAATGAVFVRPPTPVRDPSPLTRSAVNLGEHRREMAALSMSAVDAEVARAREAFEEHRRDLTTMDAAEEERAVDR